MDNTSLFLVGSHTSPYVRKLRLLLLSNDIPFELQPINYLTPDDSAYLKSINPINKIPVLFLKSNNKTQAVIYDSRIIFQYLTNLYQWTTLTIEEENILSNIDALLDSAINLFSLQRGGLDTKDGKNSYIVRQWERLDLILRHLIPWILKQNPNTQWNFLNISLYSFLDWASFRGIISLESYPQYKDYLNKFSNCKGVSETEIPKT